jgi:hypothetical protein
MNLSAAKESPWHGVTSCEETKIDKDEDSNWIEYTNIAYFL